MGVVKITSIASFSFVFFHFSSLTNSCIEFSSFSYILHTFVMLCFVSCCFLFLFQLCLNFCALLQTRFSIAFVALNSLQLMRNSLSLFLSLWRLCFELVVVVVAADLLATSITHA